jgi:ribosomal protein S18 acetylase RimI-like enzyme
MDESYDEAAIIEAANSCENVLDEVKIEQLIVLYNTENIAEYPSVRNALVSFRKIGNLDEQLQEEIFEIFEQNMKHLYEQTWGWDREKRIAEIFGKDSRFLLVHSPSGELIGFTMFKFEWDDIDEPEYPVCYCYELQIKSTMRRNAIGKHLMNMLIKIGSHYRMWKVMLTCFKRNDSALNFYSSMGFQIDSNSPSNHGFQTDYEILSFKLYNV